MKTCCKVSMPEKNLKHIHMFLVWGSALIISVKNSTLSNFLFKECFASKQFLENNAQLTR